MSHSAPRIGRMRQRLALQAATLADDGSRVWTTFATVWGALSQPGLTERDAAGRSEGVTLWRIGLRWRGDLGSACRILWGSRIFRLIAVTDPDGDRRWLIIDAEEEAT